MSTILDGIRRGFVALAREHRWEWLAQAISEHTPGGTLKANTLKALLAIPKPGQPQRDIGISKVQRLADFLDGVNDGTIKIRSEPVVRRVSPRFNPDAQAEPEHRPTIKETPAARPAGSAAPLTLKPLRCPDAVA